MKHTLENWVYRSKDPLILEIDAYAWKDKDPNRVAGYRKAKGRNNSGWRESNPHDQLGRLDRGQSETQFPGDKQGFSEVSDTEVTTEVTSDPEKMRISGPISPAVLIQLLDACPLPALVKHTIKTLIEPYVGSTQPPMDE